MKNDFTFEEIYPWQDKPEITPTGGGGGRGPKPTPTLTKGPSSTPSPGGQPVTPTEGKGPKPTPTKGDERPETTPTVTKGGGQPPKDNEPKKYEPKNLDDHIELGNEPEEVLPSGDKPNPPMSEEEREKKRRLTEQEIKERSLSRGRGMGEDRLFPNEYMEFSDIKTVDYKSELRKLLENISIVFSDKIHPHSYSHGYAEYKTEKVPEKLTVVVAIDVSGSIVDKAKEFLNEAYKIGKSFPKVKLMVVLWSDGVESFGFCENKDQLQGFLDKMLKTVKSGGTNMSPVAKVVTQNIINRKLTKKTPVIYITDGAIEPNPVLSTLAKANFIYVVTGGTLDVVLPLRKKYSNLKVAWINI